MHTHLGAQDVSLDQRSPVQLRRKACIVVGRREAVQVLGMANGCDGGAVHANQ